LQVAEFGGSAWIVRDNRSAQNDKAGACVFTWLHHCAVPVLW
jgi:hypothetical protein